MSIRRPAALSTFWVAFATVLLGGLSSVHAGDYDRDEFAVRLPPAFIRFTEVSSLGGETVANRHSSAINPASLGWMELYEDQRAVVAPYYSLISFEEGTRLNLYGETLTILTEDWGGFQPVASQIRSNNERNRNGVTFDYHVDVLQVQWGKRYGAFAVGFTLNYNEVEIRQERSVSEEILVEVPLSPVPLPGVTTGGADTRILASSYRFRVGALYEFSEKWLAGLMAEYGYNPFRTRTEVETETEVALPEPFPPMEPIPFTETIRDSGDQHQILARPGISFEYDELSNVHFDYAFGSFFGDEGDAMNHRFSLGADHRLLDWLWVRGNVGIDTRGKTGASIGVGLYFTTWGSVDIGYRINTLPELHPDFGRDNSLQVTMSFRF